MTAISVAISQTFPTPPPLCSSDYAPNQSRVSHIVMMGMVCLMPLLLLLLLKRFTLQGEPLYNWKNVKTAVTTMLSGNIRTAPIIRFICFQIPGKYASHALHKHCPRTTNTQPPTLHSPCSHCPHSQATASASATGASHSARAVLCPLFPVWERI